MLSNRRFVRELYERYDGAKQCMGCGDPIDQPEWHHIVPVAIGGKDIPSNIVPLCRACHNAITYMKPVWAYRVSDYSMSGRKPVRPDNCDAILEDYLRCRIPKSVAMERLGKSDKFIEMRFYRDYKKQHGIASSKNFIDIRLAKRGWIAQGEEVGRIEYDDGRIEKLYFGAEKPITGAFDFVSTAKRR